MDLKAVYEFSYDYLVAKAEGILTKQQIDDFISTPDTKGMHSITEAYELLLAILQDFNRYPSVIKYAVRKDVIKEILHGYDMNYISKLDPEDLMYTFKKHFQFDRDLMWLRYSKGVITGAQFMLRFKDYSEFKSVLDSFDVNDMTREALVLLLSRKIFNMGFALACNWIKELGYYRYAKPDTHTTSICKALGLIKENDDDLACFEAMARVAKEANIEAYKLDKVWWLICSGNFYRYNVMLPEPGHRLKTEFLSVLKEHFSN